MTFLNVHGRSARRRRERGKKCRRRIRKRGKSLLAEGKVREDPQVLNKNQLGI